MRITLTLLVLMSLLSYSFSSFAIDPGTATGTLKVDGDAVNLTHAYAHFHDNAEGWLDTDKEMRILVSDREVEQEVLSGLNPFFTLTAMVKQGLVRGVLLRFDPSKPDPVLATILYPPKDQGQALASKKIGDSKKGALENLALSELRVSASVNQTGQGNPELGWPSEEYRFKFSAPLFNEPAVTATLKDKNALNSPQVKVILARAAALIKGDLDKIRQYSSEGFIRRIENIRSRSQEDAGNLMREAGEEIERSVKKGRLRLIVRGNHASLIVNSTEGDAMYRLTKIKDGWVVD